jgi:hypothetical protein
MTLHVKVDIIPRGVEAARFTVEEVFVTNDGTSEDSSIGHYDVFTQRRMSGHSGHIGRIEDFDRQGANANRNELARIALQMLDEARPQPDAKAMYYDKLRSKT